jgi:hypothetical protein
MVHHRVWMEFGPLAVEDFDERSDRALSENCGGWTCGNAVLNSPTNF